ncbi:hypothetical protein GCM10018955_18890 [Planomonospora venezuelensis]
MDLLGEDEIRRFLTERIATRCRLPLTGVDPDRPLEEFGLSSRDAVAVAGELETLLGRELGPTLVWEYPTVNRLARGLAASAADPSSAVADPAAQAVRRAAPDEPVAVIGVGCRLPGGIHGPGEFWRLLMAGGDAVGQVPEGRWEAFDDGSPHTAEALAGTTRHGGFLGDVAGFDADFFGIVPGEAETMDPQQRLLLETAWEALEHAGVAPRSLRGSRTGAFVGISGNEYAYLTTADVTGVDAWTATGAAFSIAANRLSYVLDLRGPSLAVDTACSSSLVATDLAVRSLRSGESDLALAAGVNLLLSPVVTIAFDRGGGTAPDGRCKAFDASADGMVRAEGCGVVVLKRLADARRDGDRVLAVVRATAVNQDGRSNGLVAPNPEAQEELLRTAYAGLEPPDYIEAHGTGTFLGDPIEARAIDAALPPGHRVLLGSAKSNLGHLEAAAGITGLIKTVLALHHGVIPPSVHFREPNPHIPWERLEVVTAPTPWPGERPRAGVSSFGFGGTNAHVVLDAAVPQAPAEPSGDGAETSRRETGRRETGRRERDGARVFLLTDVSAERVRAHAGVLAAWAGGRDRPAPDGPAPDGTVPDGTALEDVAHTLARRAGRGRVGAAVVARDAGELVAGLRAVHEGRAETGLAVAGGAGPVWVFSGYGSQWAGMGARLYAEEPVFAAAIDELDPLLLAEAEIPLREIVAGGARGRGRGHGPAGDLRAAGGARPALDGPRRTARGGDRALDGRGRGGRGRGRDRPARRGPGDLPPGPAARHPGRRRGHGRAGGGRRRGPGRPARRRARLAAAVRRHRGPRPGRGVRRGGPGAGPALAAADRRGRRALAAGQAVAAEAARGARRDRGRQARAPVLLDRVRRPPGGPHLRARLLGRRGAPPGPADGRPPGRRRGRVRRLHRDQPAPGAGRPAPRHPPARHGRHPLPAPRPRRGVRGPARRRRGGPAVRGPGRAGRGRRRAAVPVAARAPLGLRRPALRAPARRPPPARRARREPRRARVEHDRRRPLGRPLAAGPRGLAAARPAGAAARRGGRARPGRGRRGVRRGGAHRRRPGRAAAAARHGHHHPDLVRRDRDRRQERRGDLGPVRHRDRRRRLAPVRSGPGPGGAGGPAGRARPGEPGGDPGRDRAPGRGRHPHRGADPADPRRGGAGPARGQARGARVDRGCADRRSRCRIVACRGCRSRFSREWTRSALGSRPAVRGW